MPNFKTRPAYCPLCQRLYRKPPSDYVCVEDHGALIDMADPLPKSPFMYRFRHNKTMRVLLGLAAY